VLHKCLSVSEALALTRKWTASAALQYEYAMPLGCAQQWVTSCSSKKHSAPSAMQPLCFGKTGVSSTVFGAGTLQTLDSELVIESVPLASALAATSAWF